MRFENGLFHYTTEDAHIIQHGYDLQPDQSYVNREFLVRMWESNVESELADYDTGLKMYVVPATELQVAVLARLIRQYRNDPELVESLSLIREVEHLRSNLQKPDQQKQKPKLYVVPPPASI